MSSAPANTPHENVSPGVETITDDDHSGEGITDEGFFTTKKSENIIYMNIYCISETNMIPDSHPHQIYIELFASESSLCP